MSTKKRAVFLTGRSAGVGRATIRKAPRPGAWNSLITHHRILFAAGMMGLAAGALGFFNRESVGRFAHKMLDEWKYRAFDAA